MNDPVALLKTVSELEPSFQGFEPGQMDLDRVKEAATLQLRNCEGLDLLTTVWRGRIIAATKTVFESRDASALYNSWLKDNSLTEAKATKLIATAQQADSLLDQKKLSLEGIANIALKAFETVAEDINTLTVVAELAEGGAEVTVDTAKRLLDEQTVAQTEVFNSEVKEKASEGQLPVSKTAKLVKQLETLEAEDAQEISSVLETEPTIDSLNECLEQSKSLNKFRDTVDQVENLKGLIESERLLAEAQRLDILPLVAQILGLLCDVENLTTKLHTKKSKLTNLCDRLYTETGSADHNLRAIADKFGLGMKYFEVPFDSEGNKVIQLITEILDIADNPAQNMDT